MLKAHHAPVVHSYFEESADNEFELLFWQSFQQTVNRIQEWDYF